MNHLISVLFLLVIIGVQCTSCQSSHLQLITIFLSYLSWGLRLSKWWEIKWWGGWSTGGSRYFKRLYQGYWQWIIWSYVWAQHLLYSWHNMGKNYFYICHNFSKLFMKIEKIVPTSLRLNPVYIKVYLIYLSFILTSFVFPFILLIYLNISIYRQVCNCCWYGYCLSCPKLGQHDLVSATW